MPRRPRIPNYALHKPSGQARVIIDGKHVYLGRYDSPESREAYARLIAERFASPGANAPPASMDRGEYPDISIAEMLVDYVAFAEEYYVSDGQPTQELTSMKESMGHLRALYASLPAREFGPKALKALQQHMITECDLSRGVINARINRIRRIFKWAVSEELVPPSVYEALRTVQGLRYGRTKARETEPVRPVADQWIYATLPYLSPQVAAMVQLQRLTGMRPGDVVRMRPCDIDMSGDVWIYEPAHHKNRWRGHRRLIPLGPRAQAIVRPFLNRATDAHLFSPAEAERWRHEQRQQEPSKRKTPCYPSEARRVERKKAAARRRKRKRAPRAQYDRDSYRRAIEYAVKKANKEGENIPHWFPLQIRHSTATEVRKQHGLEAAQVVLGHAKADVTQVYAEKNLELAVELAKATG